GVRDAPGVLSRRDRGEALRLQADAVLRSRCPGHGARNAVTKFFASLLVSGVVLACLEAAAAERVLDFQSHIRIEQSGEIAVTERIAVQAEGREIRRGILRDFPTEYRDRAGSRFKVPFSVVSVTRDGRDEPFHVEALANGVRVRIGSANVLLTPGRHE